ncbi:MAG TPA: methyltransferase domain-containing protein [Tepidisphaeraceae bacterium]|nr:methyltransferase domain-containing protein [Tepidisphaeraceae bacterium]
MSTETLAPPAAAELTVGTANEANRRIWVEQKLKALPAGWRILDAGAGEQQYRPLCGHLQYLAQDFGQYVPETDPTGLQMGQWDYGKLDIVCDIAAIPQPDASFDAILCTEVFEHIPDPIPAIREFGRLLRKGGVLILSAPFCSITHFAPHYYANGFSPFFYRKHLGDYGFEITEMTPNGNYFEYLAQEIRRITQIATRYAGIAPDAEQKAAMRRVLGFLQEASASGQASSEVLCFGYHVTAVKNQANQTCTPGWSQAVNGLA